MKLAEAMLNARFWILLPVGPLFHLVSGIEPQSSGHD
jgi:hypothetical protein